jgi:integrase/recombinase XerD
MTALRTRMIEDMKIRNLALNTQRAYLAQVSLFARHFRKSPDLLAPVYELFREKCMQAAPIAGLNDLRLYTTTQALR